MLSYTGPDDYTAQRREADLAGDDLLEAIWACEATLRAIRDRPWYADPEQLRRATAVVKIATELLEEI